MQAAVGDCSEIDLSRPALIKDLPLEKVFDAAFGVTLKHVNEERVAVTGDWQ
jgi:hypothetical protein